MTDAHVPPGALEEVPLIELTDLSESEAVDRLVDRFDGLRSPEDAVTGTMRYPADSRERIDTLLTRNSYFTGRDAVLRQLREELRSRGTAVVLQTPTIRGIGGVGKTQVALEYAHRFKEDYDVVWWLNCDPPQYVDASLVDLGKRLRSLFGASVPEEGGVDVVARQVLHYLSDRAAEALAAHLRQRRGHRGHRAAAALRRRTCPDNVARRALGWPFLPEQGAAARVLRAR